MFSDNPELILLTKKTMRIMFSTVLFLGFQMINQNAFVAMGNTRYSFLFGIMRKVLILVPLALILPHFIGVWGIYAAEAVSNPLTTIITFAVFERYMRTLKARMAENLIFEIKKHRGQNPVLFSWRSQTAERSSISALRMLDAMA